MKRAKEHRKNRGEEKRGLDVFFLLFSFKQVPGMWPSFPTLLQNGHERNSRNRKEVKDLRM